MTTEKTKGRNETMTTTRRTVLAAGLGAAAASGVASANAQTAPKTFVLVHGAWHGGWCWRRVADVLQRQGHKVFTPTLTGLGERSHLMSRDFNLDTHITDVVNVFLWEDLKDAVLVGHSYAGWVISGVAERVLPRIGAIVFVDAFMPDDGARGLDNTPEFSRRGILAAMEKGEASRPAPSAEFFGVNEKDRAWVDSKTTPQPVGVALQPIRLTGARDRVAKKTYVRAAAYPQEMFDKYLGLCGADKSWRTVEIPCGHDIMVDMPERLAEVLVEVS
jgi:pimeloyl-ACP methyl ester carboxylesterase